MGRIAGLILLWLAVPPACVSGVPRDAAVPAAIEIRSRNLEEQKDIGDGERLSVAVPNLPLLVNNGLLFGFMGSPEQVGIGAGLTIETNKRNAALFAGMPPLELETVLRQSLTTRLERPDGPAVLERLAATGRKLRLQPYCYLYGHPDAVLETRLRATLIHGAQVLWQQEFKIAAGRHAVSGPDSWSEANGRRLREAARVAMPAAVGQLLAALGAR